jgi:multiple sugar transport system ATP-binding protein
MDEPLSNLDAKLRVQMRAEIARLQRNLKTTTIYVTHDQIEAMTMGDRVAVMREGMLQQVAAPEELYDHPDNLFVAAFIGSPSMNLLEGQLESGAGGSELVVSLGEQKLTVPAALLEERTALRGFAGKPVIVGLRPEILADAAVERDPVPDGAMLRAEVELRESLGSELVVHLRTDARPAITEETKMAAADVDAAAIEALERQAHHGQATIVARFDSRSRARAGDAVEVAVDTQRLHFFDTETGRSIWS